MASPKHVLINGLSIGTGGGYTVGKELFRTIALARPGWTVTLQAITGHKLHHELEREDLPGNCRLEWAPAEARGIRARVKFERGPMARWVNSSGVDAVVQLNAQLVPTFEPPTLAHFQDPMPYRREAWPPGVRGQVLTYLKRRANRASLERAALCGWTSEYLRELICGHHGVRPARSVVFYNGVPEGWIRAAEAGLPDWSSRPMEVLSLSNVNPHKRQSLVIEALPMLLAKPGMGDLVYRIVGNCPDDYRRHLEGIAERCGVKDRVIIEGRVPLERVEEALATARAFTLMSVCESFGIPAVEAMRFGTPVVVSDCCAHPEVCGRAAELVPMDDRAALAEKLHLVLTDSARAEELRREGVANIKRFSWTAIGAHMADCLDEMLAGFPGGDAALEARAPVGAA